MRIDEMARVQIMACRHPWYDENDWWQVKYGWLDVFDAGIRLTFTFVQGEDADEWRPWDDEAYARALKGRRQSDATARWRRRLVRMACVVGVLVLLYATRQQTLPLVPRLLDVSEPPRRVDYVLMLEGTWRRVRLGPRHCTKPV